VLFDGPIIGDVDDRIFVESVHTAALLTSYRPPLSNSRRRVAGGIGPRPVHRRGDDRDFLIRDVLRLDDIGKP